MSQHTYPKNQIWQKVQEFLPQENRLHDKEMPVQEWVEMDGTSIHVDHYIPQKAKAVVVVLHGVGGNSIWQAETANESSLQHESDCK